MSEAQGALVTNTSANSPDSLPQRGYKIDQLANYILRQLGYPTWQVELERQSILDAINDALVLFSQYQPLFRYAALPLSKEQKFYLEGVDVGLGIAEIFFTEPNPIPMEIWFGNLISPAPLMRNGMDEFDSFLRWRKTWMRITSVQPSWEYDEFNQRLMIHNPLDRYHAAIVCYFPWTRTEDLSFFGAQWVKEYATERSRFLYGEIFSKFSGAIPGPVKDLQLDQQRRDKAEVKLAALEQKLFNSQTLTPIGID